MKAGKKKQNQRRSVMGSMVISLLHRSLSYIWFSPVAADHTFYYSMFEYTTRNLRTTITFTGLQNYLNVLGIADGEQGYFLKYLGNTLRLWLLNFVPPILLSLLAAHG